MSSVSIITPVWNRSDLTYKWLSQNYNHYAHSIMGNDDTLEWIIIDNGSTDDTQDVLRHWNKSFGKSLRIVSLKDNIGFGPANNRGVEVATSDIYAFISNDVEVNGDYITPIQKFFQYDHGMVLIGPHLLEHNTGWNTFKESGIIPYVAGWCVVVEACYWGMMCQWDERFIPCDYEDIDLSYQAAQRRGKLQEISLPLHHMSGKSAQAIPGGRLRVTLESQAKFMAKWGLTF